MSQEQKITPVPGPTVYEDEQEMLNENGGSAIVPHPQPGVPDIQGVQREGQVEGVVEERSQLRLVHPVRLNSRVPGFLCTHLVMSGIQKCMSRAWTKRHASESW